MKPLRHVLNANHVRLSASNQFGIDVIKGAAGTGKTTTAIHKLRSMYHLMDQQRNAEGDDRPIRALVLTFNRTLCGYIETYIEQTIGNKMNAEVTLRTFARWAMDHVGHRQVADEWIIQEKVRRLGAALPFAPAFLAEEVDYATGRFAHENLGDYVAASRAGRGVTPRIDEPQRQAILDTVIWPLLRELEAEGRSTWNDLALEMSQIISIGYDIVLVDECQDFSANQLRAVAHHVSPAPFCVTLVTDSIQRIYARGFTWRETGFTVDPNRVHTLRKNYRNTRQIVSFAAGVLDGIQPDQDGSLPSLNEVTEDGDVPVLLRGLYSDQVSWAIRYIEHTVDLEKESVAFLASSHGYFEYLKRRLKASNIEFDEITKRREWPESDSNIALLTFHSAKGLEFDHVFIIGLAGENTRHGEADQDDRLTVLRRIFAMAVCRARKTVVVGTKPGEESDLLEYFQDGTYTEEKV